MIFFVTGNGSITNFPFVPTIKIVTTSERYALLEKDMDVNAGAYLDGASMEDLGEDTLNLMIDVACGKRSVGERAGHSQVSLWRDWKQTGPTDLDSVAAVSEVRDGRPIPVIVDAPTRNLTFRALQVEDKHRSDQIGLILPTSLCSGQIAQMIANRLNARKLGEGQGNLALHRIGAHGGMRRFKRTNGGNLHAHARRPSHPPDRRSRAALGARMRKDA